MAMHGYVGVCRAMYGCVWLCMAMYGCVGLCMAVYGYEELFKIKKKKDMLLVCSAFKLQRLSF